MQEDSNPANHRYNPRQAAPALRAAMGELASDAGRNPSEFDGITLGEACRLAVETYGDDLPEFWRVWQQWSGSHDEPPAPMGEL